MAAEPSIWDITTSVGGALAGGSAVIGLFFVGMQVRAAKRSTDFQILQEFSRGAIERESAFLNAGDDSRKEQAFIELLNFLEIHAAAYNGKLLPRVSRGIVRDSLANSLAAITMAPEWARKVGDAVRTAATFEELARFMRREKNTIDSIIKMMGAHQADRLES